MKQSKEMGEFDKILKNYLPNWKLKIIHSGGGLCLHSRKEIWLDEKLIENLNIPFLLHEITHGLLSKERQHDGVWADKYTELIQSFISQNFTPNSQAIAKSEVEELKFQIDGAMKSLIRKKSVRHKMLRPIVEALTSLLKK